MPHAEIVTRDPLVADISDGLAVAVVVLYAVRVMLGVLEGAIDGVLDEVHDAVPLCVTDAVNVGVGVLVLLVVLVTERVTEAVIVEVGCGGRDGITFGISCKTGKSLSISCQIFSVSQHSSSFSFL